MAASVFIGRGISLRVSVYCLVPESQGPSGLPSFRVVFLVTHPQRSVLRSSGELRFAAALGASITGGWRGRQAGTQSCYLLAFLPQLLGAVTLDYWC